MLAHVDLEPLLGAAQLPRLELALKIAEIDASQKTRSQIDVPDQHATQMGDMADPPAARAEHTDQRDRAENHHQVLGLNRENEKDNRRFGAIFEDKPDKGMAIFRSAMESGLNGFLITREFPEKLEKKYGVSKCRIIWLTAVGGKNAVKPSDLETISLQVNDFFSKDSGIAFIDGTEYLISNNTFASVVRLIQYLKDTAAKSKSILLLSVNPESMNEKDLKVLQKEVDKII